MKRFLKKNLVNILLILVFVIGLLVLLYPNISDFINQRNSSKAVTQYNEVVAEMDEATRQEMLEAARAYNYNLMMKSERFADMSDEDMVEYLATLDVDGAGMMCYIEVEKLGIKCPVYHTTDESVLQRAIGHVEGSSLPVGGKGTHAALSGHRGLPSAVLFTNLDKMEIGDHFTIHVLGEELYYEVDQIQTVLPSDVSELVIDPNEDYVTLITCTPYGVNTHRLLVRGTRIEKTAETVYEETEETSMGITREQISLYIAAGMVLLLLIVLLLMLLSRRKNKKKDEDENVNADSGGDADETVSADSGGDADKDEHENVNGKE